MKFVFMLIAMLVVVPVQAEILDIDIALNNTRSACSGIVEKLNPLKKMAGINTGITGVGTVANTGATVVGVVKASKDKQAERLEELLAKLKELNDEAEKDPPSTKEAQLFLSEFQIELNQASKNKDVYQSELDMLNQQSKNLGNWRTGLMAGGTVTNVAGAVIAGNNRTDKDLQNMIDDCNVAVKNLRDSMMQARMDGSNIKNAEKIVSECGEYAMVDLSKIDNRATGAMWSSIVGATTGAVGTATSVVANSDKTRNDNTGTGKQ